MLGLSVLLINGAWSQIPRNGGKQEQKPQEEQNRPKVVQPFVPAIQIKNHSSEEKQNAKPQSCNYQWHELLAPTNIPNWCLVVVGALTGLIALRSLKAIARQADKMEVHATMMQRQLTEMQRQTDWLIEKERPRLSIELSTFDPFQQLTPTGESSVTGTVSIYGHTVAKVQKAEICVSTEQYVVEDVFDFCRQDPTHANLPISPDGIDLPRIIRPNSCDIRFTATVYSGYRQVASADQIKAAIHRKGVLQSNALYCRARIEYSAAKRSWTEEIRMCFWVFADPFADPSLASKYGFWEEYGCECHNDEDGAC